MRSYFMLLASVPSFSYAHTSHRHHAFLQRQASTEPTLTIPTYSPGSTAPVAGAPPLPKTFVFSQGTYPELDKVPPTNSPQVAEWMKELDGHNIPPLSPTKNGECDNDPDLAAKSVERGWWTCGGVTRDTDITACPDKMTFGVTFDDGPAEYTPTLLKYLNENQLQATFFCIGSRIMELPNVMLDEYMTGHELGVHTWSHSIPLTALTNEQIVAELGWTRKAIKEITGVTPVTMRPPYGDIDDRVRAISMAMGLIPVMWTSANGSTFDTNDWRIADGEVTKGQSISTFNRILDQASTIDTGFIVLEHDIHQVTVDIAISDTLKAAQNRGFKLQSVGECMHFPTTNLYRETSQNATFPYATKSGMVDIDGDGKGDVSVAASKVNSSTTIPGPTTNGTSSNDRKTQAATGTGNGANQARGLTSGALGLSVLGLFGVLF
ncbi:carbohydrate esterase family 4 protein [Flagelloscypha sp. PMI_526]|nr:carbohydrate esterase family 4 protein [Flagelloscypha sp. PMI_526]